MLYTEQTKKAMKLCFEAHKDQVDKCGMPYVFHPFHLAEQMTDEDTITAALLHDVVEDTHYTLEDLEKLGFSPQVLEAVALLTHADDVPYLEYVEKIKTNELANISGVTPSSVYSMLDPRRKEASVNLVKKLCDGLGITIEEFFGSELFAGLEQEIK